MMNTTTTTTNTSATTTTTEAIKKLASMPALNDEQIELLKKLDSDVEIGEQIPPELYQAVAEVLVFVYKAKNKV